MDKIKVIAICGKAGSGKDTIMRLLFESHPDSNLHKIIPVTTRPMREGESQGNPYNFISQHQYTGMLINGDMIEATSFRDWFYGTPMNALKVDKINIGIFSPSAVECLMGDNRLDVSVVYIDASAKVRLLRQLTREENPDVAEIIRRYGTDEMDFQYLGLDYEYQILVNDASDMAQALDICEKLFEITQSQSN